MNEFRRGEAKTAALVGFLAFLPFLRGALSGASLYFRDLALYFLPLRRLALDGLRSGEVLFWNPYLHEGVPLTLPAVGYPLDLLQLLRPDETGISLVLALHVPLAAVSFYFLCRGLVDVPRIAAAGGALVYALGGFLLSTTNLYVVLQAAAWAPLVVLTLARVTRHADGRSLVPAALVSAVALSTTGVEIVAQALVIGVLLGLSGSRRIARGLAGAGVAVGLAALLAAPVLLMVAAQVGDSARSQGFTTDVVLAQSVHPFTLLQTVVGGLYGNLGNLADEWWGQNFFPRGFPYILSLYLGPAALAVAAVGATGRHPSRRILTGLVAVGLIVALGRWAGLAGVVETIPGLDAFRYPVKVFFTVHLSVALLVALGLRELVSVDGQRHWRRLALLGAAAGTLLALAPTIPHLAPGASSSFAAAFFPAGTDPAVRGVLLSRVLTDAAIGGGLALAAAAVAVMALGERLAPARAAILVVALLGTDLLRTGSGLNPMVTGTFFRPSPELSSVLDSLRQGRVFTCAFESSRRYQEGRRVRGGSHETWTFAVALETLTPAFNVPLGVPTALSPDLTMLVPESRVASPNEASCRDLDALVPRLRQGGVSTILSGDPLTHPELRLREAVEPERIAPFGFGVYDLASPLPLLQVASHVVPVGSAKEGESLMAAPGFLEEGGLWVEGGTGTTGGLGRIEESKTSPGRFQVGLEAETRAVLVVREGWAAGWSAWVNGERATVRRANGRHLAVAVPAGRSVVRLRYRPGGLVPGLVLSLLAALGLGGIAWQQRARESTKGSPPTP